MDALRWPDRWPEHGPARLRPWSDADLPSVADLARDPYVPLIEALTGFAPTAGVDRVELEIEPDNAASRRVAERAGLAFVERLPQHLRIGDRPRTMGRYRLDVASGAVSP